MLNLLFLKTQTVKYLTTMIVNYPTTKRVSKYGGIKYGK